MSDKPEETASAEPVAGAFGMTAHERWIAAGVALAALLLIGLLIAAFWQPGPPRRVVMSTGIEDGAYHAYGLRYKEILARSGVELVLKPSAGAVENLERLRSKKDGVTLALVQGGLAQPGDETRLVSLGAVAYEPLWVFHRSTVSIDRFNVLAHLRVTAGASGSGTRKVAERFLQHNGVAVLDPPLLALGGLKAAAALQSGEVDVAIFVSAPDGAAVQQLMHAEGVSLLSMRRADAYVRQMPEFTKVEFPEGSIDLKRNLPPTLTQLVSLKASLVATDDIHPVMVDLLLDAAREVHGGGGLMRRPGEFPSADSTEFPMSSDAERYFKSGPSGLRRYLPFWAAVWIQRLIFFGLPVIAVGLPLFRLTPAVYRWGIRRRIYRWYGELAFIERGLATNSGDRDAHLRRLAEIEDRINGLRIPPSFAGEAYTLRSHVQMVRQQMQSR